MEVLVKPVPKVSWHKHDKDSSFKRDKVIEVFVDPRTRRYATGLTEEETKEYSEKLDVDLSSTFIEGKNHPYWSDKAAWIVLPNKTKIFNPEIPTDFIKIKNMKASPLVANSLEEYENGEYPRASHYIYDEREIIEKSAKKTQKMKKAFTLFGKATLENKLNILNILTDGRDNFKGKSTDYIDGKIGEIIDKNLDAFILYASMNKAELYARGLVKEAEHRGVLIKEGMAYTYMGDSIGFDFDGAVKYIMDPKNQEFKALLIEKLQK